MKGFLIISDAGVSAEAERVDKWDELETKEQYLIIIDLELGEYFTKENGGWESIHEKDMS